MKHPVPRLPQNHPVKPRKGRAQPETQQQGQPHHRRRTGIGHNPLPRLAVAVAGFDRRVKHARTKVVGLFRPAVVLVRRLPHGIKRFTGPIHHLGGLLATGTQGLRPDFGHFVGHLFCRLFEVFRHVVLFIEVPELVAYRLHHPRHGVRHGLRIGQPL